MNRKRKKQICIGITCAFLALPTLTAQAYGWSKNAQGQWTYTNKNGTLQTDTFTFINGKWYHFDASSAMVYGWYLEKAGRWYYFDPSSGAACMGWKEIGGKQYYFDPNQSGALFTNGTTPDGYVVDIHGVSTGAKAQYTAKDTSYNGFVQRVLALVNAYRAEVGAAPLSLSSELNNVAQVRANEIIQKFSHDRPAGTLSELLEQNGYTWTWQGENLAYGQASPEDVVTSWMNSPSHKVNILSTDFRELGISFSVKDNTYYWVQIFGNR